MFHDENEFIKSDKKILDYLKIQKNGKIKSRDINL